MYIILIIKSLFIHPVPWSNKMFCKHSFLICIFLVKYIVTNAKYYGKKLKVLDRSETNSHIS